MCIFRCKKAAETTTEENHGWIWWWVLATCIIILITIVCQLHSGKYYFDKDRYPVVATAMVDRCGPDPQDIDGFNQLIYESEKGEYLIAECTVSGGSYNVIHYSDDWETGIVLTHHQIQP